MNELPNTQIIDRLVDALGRFQAAATNTMQAAFEIGEILIELKAITPHGKFEDALKNDARVVFGIKHAQRFMKIVSNKAKIVAHSGGEPLSIREMERLLAKPKKPVAPAPVDTANDEIIDRLVIDPSHPIGRGMDTAIDAEFTAVAPQEVIAPAIGMSSDPAAPPEAAWDDSDYYDVEPDGWEPEEDQADADGIEDTQAELERLRARNAWMESIFDDDNHTAAAIREIEKLKTIGDALQNRLDAVIAENGQLQGRLNYWETRCKKLEKSNGK